jgi:uncharacterized ion transporter superfamily protein YfcC
MSSTSKNLHPISVLLLVTVLAALATWFVPAGLYSKLTVQDNNIIISQRDTVLQIPLSQQKLDSLGIQIKATKFINGSITKPISIPNTYQKVNGSSANIIDVLKAPIKGIYDAMDIIVLILIMGGFIHLFNNSGAMTQSVNFLATKLQGKEQWLIVLLIILCALGGSTFGMAEEALMLYPIVVPLFAAAGYNKIIPVAVLFGGTQLGTLSSFSNPFSTIIASNTMGINWIDGITERIIVFIISTIIYIVYTTKYAKQNRTLAKQQHLNSSTTIEGITSRNKILLLVFTASFTCMIYGVIFLSWWLTEMTIVFVAGTLIFFIVMKISEKEFIKTFIQGAESLLGVAFIIGIARGVKIILNDGKISDSLLYFTTQIIGGLPPALFVIVLLLVYMLFTLFIASSSGMAVLTMPVLGALTLLLNIPGKQTVNAYLAGMGIIGFLTPTGLMLPSLSMVNASIKEWSKFILPFLFRLLILSIIWLLLGIYT